MVLCLHKQVLLAGCLIVCGSTVYGQQRIPEKSTLSATLSGASITEKATSSIHASNIIRSGAVTYVAGERIELMDGFHVAEGANFDARIEPVGQNMEQARTGVDMQLPLEISDDPSILELSAYPNPYSDDTQVEYVLPDATQVSLSVFDEKGNEVSKVIDNEIQTRGVHKITFASKQLPPGAYLCVLTTTTQRKTHRIVKQ